MVGIILNEVNEELFEYKLSKYMVPMTIDQRYSKENWNILKNSAIKFGEGYEEN